MYSNKFSQPLRERDLFLFHLIQFFSATHMLFKKRSSEIWLNSLRVLIGWGSTYLNFALGLLSYHYSFFIEIFFFQIFYFQQSQVILHQQPPVALMIVPHLLFMLVPAQLYVILDFTVQQLLTLVVILIMMELVISIASHVQVC